MGYLTIDLKACYSTKIVNYGPWSMEIALKKPEKKQLENSGVFVQFKKTPLKVGETVSLTIVWQPTSAKYSERSTEEQHSLRFEVKLIVGLFIVLNERNIITYII